MTRGLPTHSDLMALDQRRGDQALALRIGPWVITVQGADAALASALHARWRGFATDPAVEHPTLTVTLLQAGPESWIAKDASSLYRIEGALEGGVWMARSHDFALAEAAAGDWRLAIARDSRERLDRLVENAVRYLVARLAAAAGGLAFHGAAVVRAGRAHLFLGASGAGKTTAVGLLAPATSLGDDFAIAIPGKNGWSVPAVPFDNLEAAPTDRSTGAFPLEKVWRLFQSPEDRVEKPAPVVAAASLMSCAAMPWAMPDLADRLVENAHGLVEDVPYGHLHFRRSTDLWGVIDAAGDL